MIKMARESRQGFLTSAGPWSGAVKWVSRDWQSFLIGIGPANASWRISSDCTFQEGENECKLAPVEHEFNDTLNSHPVPLCWPVSGL